MSRLPVYFHSRPGKKIAIKRSAIRICIFDAHVLISRIHTVVIKVINGKRHKRDGDPIGCISSVRRGRPSRKEEDLQVCACLYIPCIRVGVVAVRVGKTTWIMPGDSWRACRVPVSDAPRIVVCSQSHVVSAIGSVVLKRQELAICAGHAVPLLRAPRKRIRVIRVLAYPHVEVMVQPKCSLTFGVKHLAKHHGLNAVVVHLSARSARLRRYGQVQRRSAGGSDEVKNGLIDGNTGVHTPRIGPSLKSLSVIVQSNVASRVAVDAPDPIACSAGFGDAGGVCANRVVANLLGNAGFLLTISFAQSAIGKCGLARHQRRGCPARSGLINPTIARASAFPSATGAA